MKRRSSLRTTLAPIPSTPISWSPYRSSVFRRFRRSLAVLNVAIGNPRTLFGGLRDLHAAGGVEHRFDDVVVAGAAADIAFQLVADGVLVELAAIAVDDIDRRHDHARRAIAALQPVIVAERGLHRMQLVSLRDALAGRDTWAGGLSDQHGAGFDRPAVDMHDTGAALAGVAADMGAGQVQMVAQEIDKKGAVLDVGRDRLAVHRQFDCRHA